MIDRQLHQILLIISQTVLFQSLISAENATCNNCMADIYGPYPENETEINSVAIVKATESVPAVIVCRYLCYDQYQYYNFDLIIDILDPKAPMPIRRMVAVTPQDLDSDYNFTVIYDTVQTCDLSNSINETITKYWIHVGSSDVPTLIAKCFVQYSPNGLPNSIWCSNSSTLAIIPGYSILDPDTSSSITSSKTILLPLSPSSCMLSTTKIVTVTVTATPQSPPTATFGGVSGNCTDTNSTCTTIVLWVVVAVLIIIAIITFSILMACLTCAKSVKCWCTPGGTNKPLNKAKVKPAETHPDNSSSTIASSATIH